MLGVGLRDSQGEGVHSSPANLARDIVYCWGFPCELLPFLVPSVIRIVVITVCFVICLLSPVNSSYLNLWSFPFVPPMLLSIPPHGKKGGEKQGIKGVAYGLESLSGEVEPPFLNHTQWKVSFYYCDLFPLLKVKATWTGAK